MKALFQSATLLSAFAIAAIALMNFPIGAAAGGKTHGFNAPPLVLVDLLTNGKSDPLGNGWIVVN
ncbi:hypothetical protein LZG00_11135 [Rhodobacteraceae bacterium LMO-12]|nr:hypothetical protein [Rhodobacteraceae bacterium LMO-JJ12]